MIKVYSAHIFDFTQADYILQYSLLDVALRAKIDAKKSDNDKMCSLAGYILLYRGVSELYGKEKINITFNQNGKPLCDFCFFSISHSESRVVCAISNEPVGIDIQIVKNIRRQKNYKLFNAFENEYVNSGTKGHSARFTEIFTKKESAVKLLGKTLSYAAAVNTFSDEFIFESTNFEDYIMTVCKKSKI